ncbi:MAG: CPBP family intramembrane metalloprotease [Flavobacteriales bacterium]|nr:CPBP family intramembrane metalloprotease [Flavobacteriales bacterium]
MGDDNDLYCPHCGVQLKSQHPYSSQVRFPDAIQRSPVFYVRYLLFLLAALSLLGLAEPPVDIYAVANVLISLAYILLAWFTYRSPRFGVLSGMLFYVCLQSWQWIHDPDYLEKGTFYKILFTLVFLRGVLAVFSSKYNQSAGWMSHTCKNCKHSVTEKFCPACGIFNQPTSKPFVHFLFIGSFLLSLVGFTVAHRSGWIFGEGFTSVLAMDILIALVVLLYVWLDRGNMIPLLKTRPKMRPLASVILVSGIFAMAIHFSVAWLHGMYEIRSTSYVDMLSASPHSWLVIPAIMIIQPAIFEELAFRGFVYNRLEEIVPPRMALVFSSLLFGVFHFSTVALIWLLPIGFVFGIYRRLYGSIWYGVVGHLVYNGLVISLDYLL